MMLVGEETGELTRLLEEVSGFYQREVDYRLRNLTAMLEPLLIVGGRRHGADPGARACSCPCGT